MIDTILVALILSGLFIFIVQMLYVVYAPTMYNAKPKKREKRYIKDPNLGEVAGYRPVKQIPHMPKVKRPAPPAFA